MSALERFLHDDKSELPVLVRAALAHVQFETIHPFLDGNGRVGRLLITLLLSHSGILSEPLLYLSLYLKQHRARYYELLDTVRRDGDFEAWIVFFLEGVRETADGAVSTSRRAHRALRSGSRANRGTGPTCRVRSSGSRRADRAALASIPELSSRTGLSFPAASAGIELLVTGGIARELTGKRRNRIFVYEQYLAILNEGAEEQ